MLQLRPTFSESWYRVVNLRPRLRSSAQISRQYYRGDRWYVVRDPAGNQFHRLSDAAYRFIGLLDGSRTVGEAWETVGGTLADDAPTQPEVIQMLSQLYAANLVETDITPDATVLLRRHKKQMQRKMQGRLMNILFPRIRIWDPDRFLCRWMPLIGRLFLSKFGAVVWIATLFAAIVALIPHWNDLQLAARHAVDLQTNPQNAFWLYGTFILIKFIHELGHAFACRRFGGECHEMGIMLLVFIPTPYVDASSAWSFPSKWQRMLVGAGGMIIELFVAAIMAFIWVWTKDSSNVFLSSLAYNTMLIASVTTVIFNANPLLRYDGYYMLSDYLEIPNLQRKSTDYLLGLVKRHIYGVKLQQPLPPVLQRVQLFVYGILSTAYRVFVGIAIILMVAFQIPIMGTIMALGGIVTWLVVPVVKLFKYLTIDPELHRKRGRAIAFCGVMATAIIIVVGLINFPVRVRAEGVIEPKEEYVLHAITPGFVKTIVHHDGEDLKKGDIIAVLDNPSLTTEMQQAKLQLEGLKIKRQQAALTDAAQAAIAQNAINYGMEKIATLQQQIDDLTIRAPFDGRLVAPNLRHMPGLYLQRGTEVATVAQLDHLMLYATVSQSDWELVQKDASYKTEVRIAGDPNTVLYGMSPTLLPAAQIRVKAAALTNAGGGLGMADSRDPSGKTLQQPEAALRVEIANEGIVYLPGQRAYLRLSLKHRPLLEQWTNAFLRIIQQNRASQSKNV